MNRSQKTKVLDTQTILKQSREAAEKRKRDKEEWASILVIQSFARRYLVRRYTLKDDLSKEWTGRIKNVNRLLKEHACPAGLLHELVRVTNFIYHSPSGPDHRVDSGAVKKLATTAAALMKSCSASASSVPEKEFNYFGGVTGTIWRDDTVEKVMSNLQWEIQATCLLKNCLRTLSFGNLLAVAKTKGLWLYLLRIVNTFLKSDSWSIPDREDEWQAAQKKFYQKLCKPPEFWVLVSNVFRAHHTIGVVHPQFRLLFQALMERGPGANARLAMKFTGAVLTIPNLWRNAPGTLFLTGNQKGNLSPRISIKGKTRLGSFADVDVLPEFHSLVQSLSSQRPTKFRDAFLPLPAGCPRSIDQTCWLFGNLSDAYEHINKLKEPNVYLKVLQSLSAECSSQIFENEELEDFKADYQEDEFALLRRSVMVVNSPAAVKEMFWRLFPVEVINFEDRVKFIYKPDQQLSPELYRFVSSTKCHKMVMPIWQMFLELFKSMSQEKQLEYQGTILWRSPILSTLWGSLCRIVGTELDGTRGSQELWVVQLLDCEEAQRVLRLFLMFYKVYWAASSEEDQFLQQVNPLNRRTLFLFIKVIRRCYFRIVWENNKVELAEPFGHFLKLTQQRFLRVSVEPKGFDRLYELDAKEQSAFEEAYEEKDEEEKKKAGMILKFLPFSLTFDRRLEIFRQMVGRQKRLWETDNSMFRTPRIAIRRDNLLWDAFNAVNQLGSNFAKKVKIVFVDEFGQSEEGLDVGGVFKEFIELCLKKVLSDGYGLFKCTPGGLYYPNPAAADCIPEYTKLFEFIGRLCGKALLDGILLDVPFAPFFLRNLLYSSVFVSDLFIMDPELYKGLMFAKHYDGDMEDLCLTFSVVSSTLGTTKEIDLIPNGSKTPVTRDNIIAYSYKMASYYTCKAIASHVSCFVFGFNSMVEKRYISLFNYKEFVQLLSGDSSAIDVEDWRRYSVYDQRSRTVKDFWNIVKKDFDDEERKKLLRFVTSVSRPPLKGFKYLQPPFTIRYAEGDQAINFGAKMKAVFTKKKSKEKLPTASTCFNLLKLPNYPTKKILREKLRQCINEGKGLYLT